MITGCSSGKIVEGNSLYCHLDVGSQVPMALPPENADELRKIAKMYPNDPNSFGPPPTQQQFSGVPWDQKNEYWYATSEGHVYVYSNTDDFYVYFWHFENSSSPILEDHALVDCSV